MLRLDDEYAFGSLLDRGRGVFRRLHCEGREYRDEGVGVHLSLIARQERAAWGRGVVSQFENEQG